MLDQYGAKSHHQLLLFRFPIRNNTFAATFLPHILYIVSMKIHHEGYIIILVALLLLAGINATIRYFWPHQWLTVLLGMALLVFSAWWCGSSVTPTAR
jgi:hypothetical protein